LAHRVLVLGGGVALVVAGLEATGVVGIGHDLVGLGREIQTPDDCAGER
jgi:hypothetical protein